MNFINRLFWLFGYVLMEKEDFDYLLDTEKRYYELIDRDNKGRFVKKEVTGADINNYRKKAKKGKE